MGQGWVIAGRMRRAQMTGSREGCCMSIFISRFEIAMLACALASPLLSPPPPGRHIRHPVCLYPTNVPLVLTL